MQQITHKKEFEFKTILELKEHLNQQVIDDNNHEGKMKIINSHCLNNIEYLDHQISYQQFYELYDAKIPVILKNLDKNWRNWEWDYLFKTYKDHYFRVGIDDDGNYLKVKFEEYVNYLKQQCDSNPLYLFDGDIPDNMVQQYQIPQQFPQDYLEYIQQQRPQYRWFLLGPKYSGSMIHVDPYQTSAWNTVVLGKKRWIMFPPQINKKIVKGKSFEQQIQTNPIDYFYNIIPEIIKYCQQEKIKYYEFIQNEHDTVYVPNGWWHAVLNIEDSVAITQNYVGEANFNQFWIAFYKENPALSYQLFKVIEQKNSRLFQLANELNTSNNIKYQFEGCDETISEKDSLDEFQNQFD